MRPSPTRSPSRAATASTSQPRAARGRLRAPRTRRLTPDQIRAAWMARASARLGRAPARLEPVGRARADGRRATRRSSRSAAPCSSTAGISAEYAKLPLDEVNRRVAAAMAAADDSPTSILNDPLGPLWYRGLVGARRRCRGRARRDSRRPPRLTADQELDAVLAAYGAQRLVIGHTPSLDGHRDHQRRPARAHRYRHFALLRRAAELARDRRRPDDPAHCAEVGADEDGAMQSHWPSCAGLRSRPAAAAGAAQAPVRQRRRRSTSRSRRRSPTLDPQPRGAARVAGTLTDPSGQSPTDQPRAARDHPPHSRHLRLPAAARRVHRAAAGRLAVRRPEAAEARHPLPAARAGSSKCAARIFRLPDVQSADPAQLPRAARQHRLSSTTSGRPIVSRVGFFLEDLERRRQAQRHDATRTRRDRIPRRRSQPAGRRRATRCSNI